MTPDQIPSIDHDLLIELRTEMRGVRSDIQKLTDDTKERIVRLEESKVTKEDFSMHLREDGDSHKDHETRIRFIERYMWAAIGIVAIAEFTIMVWINIKR